MKLKRWLCMLLVLCMVMVFIPVTASAATTASGHCGAAGVRYDVTWTLENGVLKISGNGAMFNYAVQNYAPWYSYRDEIVEVVVSDGVTSIGNYAFDNCQKLEKVTLGGDVEVIGEQAFSACVALKKLTLPQSLKEIKSTAFYGTGLTSINIPASVETIETGAFLNNYSLTSISVDKNNAAYSSDSKGILFSKDKTRLILCPQGFAGNYTVPSGVKVIAEVAFQNCKSLTGITIPSSVTTIERFVFGTCDELASVTLSEGLQVIGKEAFYGCEKLVSIEIPGSVTMIEDSAFSWCRGLKDLWFLGDAPTFGEYLFSLVTANAHYPENHSTWTQDVMQNYGGNITWIPYETPVIRLAGANRWNTALKVADEMKTNLGDEKFDAIIIASGSGFADALAGSYLATVKNAPILLSYGGDNEKYAYLDTDNINYVKENLSEGGKVYILGGVNAVPELYEEGLEGYDVVRLGGANRFETNILILEEAGIADGAEVLVCTSSNFADSLSASATGKPILLVWNEEGILYGDQPEFLYELKEQGCTFTIIGGENAVGTALAETISTYGDVERLAGENRFETSVLVARKYFEAPEYAVLAYAWNYPDGLCGGALAYTLNAPLVLTMTNYETQASEYIQAQEIAKGIVLGGETLISNAAIRTVFAMAADAPVAVK